MKKNGYSAAEMLVVIAVLGVITLLVLVNTSSAFKDNSEDLYEETTHIILKQAEEYGSTLTELTDGDYKIISLNEMVKAGYYVADDDKGNVQDPRKLNSNLNDLKIKITRVGNEYRTEIIEES